MSTYLSNLFDAAKNAEDAINRVVENIRSMKLEFIWPEEDPGVGFLTFGEFVLHSYPPEEITEELRLRFRIFLNTIGQVIVQKMEGVLRTQYGDIQASWLENRDEIVDQYTAMYESLIFGKNSHLVPRKQDLEEGEDGSHITDMTRHHFVEIQYCIAVPTQMSNGITVRVGDPDWGLFRVACGKWVPREGTHLLFREIVEEWPVNLE